MDRNVVRQKVVNRLSNMTAPKYRRVPITDDTEIYYDLHIYGDDLYEFVQWVGQEFGVRFHISLPEYGRSETVFPFFFRRSRERREREERPYKSLKVTDILDAVAAGHWPLDQAA